MPAEVNVLRVFTDDDDKFGNRLGVVSARAVAGKDRQRIAARLDYSETVFTEDPEPRFGTAGAEKFTPALDLLFATEPAVAAARWSRERGTPIRSLQLRAGVVGVHHSDDLTTVEVSTDWTPEFALHELNSPQDVLDADPNDYPDDVPHCLWAWIDKSAGHIRSRVFAPELAIQQDGTIAATAIRITDYLSRDLIITQGNGSMIYAWCYSRGWLAVGCRVIYERRTRIM